MNLLFQLDKLEDEDAHGQWPCLWLLLTINQNEHPDSQSTCQMDLIIGFQVNVVKTVVKGMDWIYFFGIQDNGIQDNRSEWGHKVSDNIRNIRKNSERDKVGK